jgi:mannosyltransferase
VRARKAEWAIAVLILLGAWALYLQRLDGQDIWWDEARNIEVAARPLSQIAGAPELDIHPPLYFYSLHLWTTFVGTSAFATRLFGACFGLLAAALTYRLARGLAPGSIGRMSGLLALILAAFSPYLLAEAQETRMYTFTWALLSAGALAMWQAVEARSRRGAWLWWLAFAVLSVASLLAHYSAVLILVPWAIWLLGWALRGPDRLARLGTLATVGLVAVLLCLPALSIALRQIPGYQNPNLNLPTVRAYLGQLAQAFTLGEHVPDTAWTWGRWLWLLLPLGGALLALRDQAVALRDQALGHHDRARSRLALLALWLFGGLALYYLLLTQRSAFNPRYISFVLPALWALAGWALTGWRRLFKPLPWILTAVLLGVAIPSLHADLTDQQYYHVDTRGVVAWLEEHATTRDIILVDQRYPFGFYWERWDSSAYGFPPAEPADQPPAQYLFVDLNQIAERLTELAGNAETVYWVTWFESDIDPRGSVPALLNTYGEKVGELDFRGYKVHWWQLQPPTHFESVQELLPLNLAFEPGMTLLEGDWQGRLTPATAGRPALVTLRWQAGSPTARPLKVSLRLRGEDGAMLAQDDRVLLNDRHLRTTAWEPGETALALYTLALPPGAGTYQVTVVLYDEESLEAAGLRDGSGVEPILGTLRVEP